MNAWLSVTKLLVEIEECAGSLLSETPAAGLNLKQVHILNALYEEDGQGATSLSKAIGRRATSFTPILDSVETLGFVVRKADPEDRRAIKVYLTPKGEALRADIQYALVQLDNFFANAVPVKS